MNVTDDSQSKRALVVEDNIDSAAIFSKFVIPLGYAVEISRNGTEALTVAAIFAPPASTESGRMPQARGTRLR